MDSHCYAANTQKKPVQREKLGDGGLWTKTDLWFPTGGTPGNVWRYFLSQLGRWGNRCHLVSVGLSPDPLLNTLQCAGQPLSTQETKNYWVPNSNSAEVEKPCPGPFETALNSFN